MRIVSLLPSATEIICSLGLRDQLVGVTHECDYPPNVAGLPVVTTSQIPSTATSQEIDAMVREQLDKTNALYSLKEDVLESLSPDLIVTQTLCDVCAVAAGEVQRAILRLSHVPEVLNLEPSSLGEVLNGFRDLAAIVEKVSGKQLSENANSCIRELESRIDRVRERNKGVEPKSVVLMEWIDPPFSAGHWSPEIVGIAGGKELLGIAGERSQTISWERVRTANPDVLVLACCGFDVPRTMQDRGILESYPGWNSMKCVQQKQVYVVDGSAYFSRPGPRLVDSLEILANVLWPGKNSLPAGLSPATPLL